MDKIGASDALVHLAMKPLSVFKKYPYVLCSLVLPLGQFLNISNPSAAGLGLLLMATVFPVIINLGVSRLSAVAIISATTAFGIGPTSPIALSAADVINMDITAFFIGYQIPLTVVLSITMTVTYYFVNVYFDKKNTENFQLNDYSAYFWKDKSIAYFVEDFLLKELITTYLKITSVNIIDLPLDARLIFSIIKNNLDIILVEEKLYEDVFIEYVYVIKKFAPSTRIILLINKESNKNYSNFDDVIKITDNFKEELFMLLSKNFEYGRKN